MTVAARLLIGANTVALLVLAGAWSAAAGEVRISDQLLWASVATVAAAAVSVADVSYLLVLRRGLLAGRLALDLPEGNAVRPAMPEPTGPTVVVAGGTRSHRSDCLLVTGKPTQAAEDEGPGGNRCSVCFR